MRAQDLGSTHGTFLNKSRLMDGSLHRVNVGDVLSFGQSTRLYIMQGPAQLQPREVESERLRDLRAKATERSARFAAMKVKSKLRARSEGGANRAKDDGVTWGLDVSEVGNADTEQEKPEEEEDVPEYIKKSRESSDIVASSVRAEDVADKDKKLFEKVRSSLSMRRYTAQRARMQVVPKGARARRPLFLRFLPLVPRSL